MDKAFRLQDTRICGNTPDQISGGYLDLGGNCIETICVNCPDVPGCPDSDADGVCDEDDVCPGEPDQDTDADGVVDCLDECPEDPTKVTFGRCGCGVVDTTILGDFDCDGDFDQDDYLAMGKALGEDGCSGESGCSGDLNNDGVVDGADLTIILSNWGCVDQGCEGDLNDDDEVGGVGVGEQPLQLGGLHTCALLEAAWCAWALAVDDAQSVLTSRAKAAITIAWRGSAKVWLCRAMLDRRFKRGSKFASGHKSMSACRKCDVLTLAMAMFRNLFTG